MAASAASPEDHPARASPPTPIATGKGLRSAAVDDRALTDYLETSLKVPDLALPPIHHHRRHTLPSIRLNDAASTPSIRRLAAETGCFGVERGGVSPAQVEAVVEIAGGRVFGGDAVGERCLGRRRGAWNELCWYRPMRPEDESTLEMLLSDAYPSLRKKLDDISLRLEEIAEMVMGSLWDQLKSPPSTTERAIDSQESILRLRKYDSQHLKDGHASFEEGHRTIDHSAHVLSLHVSLKDQEFCIRTQEGSNVFFVPRGLVIVTVGKLLREWSNNEYKFAIVEPLMEPDHDADPLFTLEFLWSPGTPRPRTNNSFKTISLIDQILIVFALAFIYELWTYVNSKFSNT